MTNSTFHRLFLKACAIVILSYAGAPISNAQETAGAPVPIVNHHHHYYGGPGYYQNVRVNDVTNPEIAKGQYNLYTAEAVGALQSARHQSIENHAYAVDNYYNNKRLHNEYAAETKGVRNEESRAEFLARETAPGRLTAKQFDRATKVINWPPLLRDSGFTAEREKLDQLFDQRTPESSGPASDNYEEIQRQCAAMDKLLGNMLRSDKLDPMSFIAAKHFIKSLAYEARFQAK